MITGGSAREQRRDFSIRREILLESEGATDAEVSQREIGYVRALRSNDPEIGYNRWPRADQRKEPG
jgi:hypothetical protein